VAFLAHIARGETRILEPEKFDDLRWFSVDELPPNCGLHHVILPLHQLGWISGEEYQHRLRSTGES
jgi:hypothetical protein